MCKNVNLSCPHPLRDISWFNPGMDSSQINISRYTVFTKSRADRKGGGVAIMSKMASPLDHLTLMLELNWSVHGSKSGHIGYQEVYQL